MGGAILRPRTRATTLARGRQNFWSSELPGAGRGGPPGNGECAPPPRSPANRGNAMGGREGCVSRELSLEVSCVCVMCTGFSFLFCCGMSLHGGECGGGVRGVVLSRWRGASAASGRCLSGGERYRRLASDIACVVGPLAEGACSPQPRGRFKGAWEVVRGGPVLGSDRRNRVTRPSGKLRLARLARSPPILRLRSPRRGRPRARRGSRWGPSPATPSHRRDCRPWAQLPPTWPRWRRRRCFGPWTGR